MSTLLLALNYPAPIPVGHPIEITEFADTRPEKKRKRFGLAEAFHHPALQDLETGIRYMNHVHASAGNNGGNALRSNRYPLTPRGDLQIARIWRARVTACTIVSVEGLSTSHTTLAVEALT